MDERTTMESSAGPLQALLSERLPGARLEAAEPLGPDGGEGAGGATEKAAGYGQPLLLTVELPGGGRTRLVLRTATPNEFGHDRRADRAADTLLAFDRFGVISGHARALDVGAVMGSGELRSLAGAEELYLLTEYAEGTLYAQDLRRLAEGDAAGARDERRCAALARYLARLHREQRTPAQYRRSVRDLLGHGEGIFGICDAYPEGTPAAPPERLLELERRCLEWRWRLRAFEHRAARIHGDFHPFNIVFGPRGKLSLLDAARGCAGDPADDVTALAVNYVFFAVDVPGAWERGFRDLWRLFWRTYEAESGDEELRQVAPPYLTWRLLVVCLPKFYPRLSERGRDLLLGFAERALVSERFDPASAEELFS
ncbi:MAG TPA: aminoglycoside phosphotransferase family protein [Myxococcales bacterium]|nr:aminoglycoside phosphotransferase family protein [Myxococcales bacterium]